jgi:hypothetical protein
MKKNCQPSPLLRERQKRARHPANKVGKLEEKLDGLVALLKSTTSGTPEYSDTTLVNPTNNHDTIISKMNLSATAGTRYGGYISNQLLLNGNSWLDSTLTPAATSPSGSVSTKSPFLIHPALEPSPEDADSYLNQFRTDFIKYLPFLVIAPSVSA